MRHRGGIVAPLVLIALLALGVAGCGQVGQSAGGSPTSTWWGPTGPAATTSVYSAEVSQVTTDGQPDRLVLTLDVPAGGPGCALVAQTRMNDDSYFVRVDTTFTSRPTRQEACTGQGQLTAQVTIPALRGRKLAINGDLWALRDDGSEYHPCDEQLGCVPPEDRCDRVYVDQMLAGSELAPERSVKVIACAAPWMVLDVNAVISGCQSVDGAPVPDGCRGRGTHRRWFAYDDPVNGWDVVASGTEAGCTEAQAQAPRFPTALCADLAAFGSP